MSLLILRSVSASITLLTLLFHSLVTPARSQPRCSVNSNFTSNSTYAENRRVLLSSLPSNISTNRGFFSGSLGASPDKVYAIGLCRVDLPPQNWTANANATATELMQSCPYQKQAAFFIWDNHCSVRYSDTPIHGVLDTSSNLVLSTTRDMSWDNFYQIWRNHLESLAVQASEGNTTRKFATGEVTLSDSTTMYTLLQCNPDLSRSDCHSCLVRTIDMYEGCCRGKSGGAVPLPSCYMQWDLYYFYLYSPAPPPPSLPPPPPSLQPPPPDSTSPPLPPPDLSPSPPVLPNTTSLNKDAFPKASLAAAILVPAICFMIIVVIAVVLLRRRWKLPSKLKDDWSPESDDSLLFKLSDIRAATYNFSDTNKLGEGGFGSVYKGLLKTGQEIAVKRLGRSSHEGKQQFKNEIMLMARLQHKNLVKLLGFCFEQGERILVYEFVPFASLDRFVSDPNRRVLLDWAKRYKIIEGIARGLLYLHVDSQLRIIHRDLKPGNVLLDEEMNPKIADFGTARLFDSDQSKERTRRIAGTFGYMPPEYVKYGVISLKTDVYGFGVVMLEIISGRKNGHLDHSGPSSSLVSYVWKNWKKGTPMKIVDPFLKDSPRSEILKCIHVAFLCLQEDVARRPTMASVTLMLNNASCTLPVPSRPAFLTDAPSNTVCTVQALSSINEVSFSGQYPR